MFHFDCILHKFFSLKFIWPCLGFFQFSNLDDEWFCGVAKAGKYGYELWDDIFGGIFGTQMTVILERFIKKN